MNEKIFDKTIKVLWIIIACVALYTFHSKIDPVYRYEVIPFKGKKVYRFDKLKGTLAEGLIPTPTDVYYQYEENGYLLTIGFALPENDGTANGMQNAINKRNIRINNWYAEHPNARRVRQVTVLDFQDVVK